LSTSGFLAQSKLARLSLAYQLRYCKVLEIFQIAGETVAVTVLSTPSGILLQTRGEAADNALLPTFETFAVGIVTYIYSLRFNP